MIPMCLPRARRAANLRRMARVQTESGFCRRWLLGIVLMAATALVALPAQAQQDPFAAYDGTLVDTANRLLFKVNRSLYSGLDATLAWASGAIGDGAAADVGIGVTNMLSNIINEPLTALSSIAVGDTETARRAVDRFAINSTEGVLGWRDRASERGLRPVHSDIGLALCGKGIGEGTYVVLPVVGPRTARDAAADIALMSAILWGTVLGLGGAGGVQALIVVEVVEVIGEIVATRQIDPQAKAIDFSDYEAMRRAYLTQRRLRCENKAAEIVAGSH
jgi:phospholipid-binding lipoprotein MlaA